VIAIVLAASEQDIAAAVDAATKAQPAWASLASSKRASVLRKFADLMADNASKLAEVADSTSHICVEADIASSSTRSAWGSQCRRIVERSRLHATSPTSSLAK